ncbi:MAG: hypothetical protein OJF60_000656 [Burkholderiaceae bacterium]|jgi:hypothetical protein|nr:MAG: hypothetical protein OJF60_000656 [Burkholderiaceae bacterium]
MKADNMHCSHDLAGGRRGTGFAGPLAAPPARGLAQREARSLGEC